MPLNPQRLQQAMDQVGKKVNKISNATEKQDVIAALNELAAAFSEHFNQNGVQPMSYWPLKQ
jgi:ribosome maturation protein Sdo1